MPKIIVGVATLVWMIFCPPAAAAATIMGFDVTMALPAPATGEPGVLCTTITEGRFGVEGRNICEDEKCRYCKCKILYELPSGGKLSVGGII